MAHQLTKQGEEVSFLFLVDPSDIIEEKETLQDTKSKYGNVHHDRKVTQKTGEKIYSLFRKTFYVIKRIKHRSIIMMKVAICEMYIRLGHPLPHTLRSFYFPNHYVTKILKDYIPKIYSGRAALFSSDKIWPGTHEGWNALITGGVEIHEVSEATHHTIQHDPYVGQWAQILNTYLEKAQEAEDAKAD